MIFAIKAQTFSQSSGGYVFICRGVGATRTGCCPQGAMFKPLMEFRLARCSGLLGSKNAHDPNLSPPA